MKNAVQATIDTAGRIIVPKSLRDELRIAAGQKLSLRVHNGVLEVEPVAEPVTLKKSGRLVVATAAKRVKLSSDTVARTRSRLRDEEA